MSLVQGTGTPHQENDMKKTPPTQQSYEGAQAAGAAYGRDWEFLRLLAGSETQRRAN